MLLLGYPKSGNTWIAYMLSYIFNTVYDDYDAQGIHPKRESIRKYVKGGLSHKSLEKEIGHVLKTHKLNIETHGDIVTYVVRDPRDVMVSYYHYRKNIKSIDDSTNLHQFIKLNLPQWVEHVNEWIDRSNSVIRYEDAINDLHACLNKLCGDLGVTVDEYVITEAEYQFSFKNMSGRERGVSDDSSFFRKGVVGDWKTYLDHSDIEYVEANAKGLMLRLGYD